MGSAYGPFVYAWSGPAAFSAGTAAISVTNAGTYTVTITDTNGATATASGTLTVNPLPTVSVNSGAVCAGGSVTLAATVGSGTAPFTYAWSGPAGFSASPASISTSLAGTYSVTVTDKNGCTAGASGAVTIYPVAGATVNSGSVFQGRA